MYWSFTYSPALPGGRIDRNALNETMEETRRASSFRSDSAFNDGAGIRSYKYDRVPILAKITGFDESTSRYSWTQVYSNFDGSYSISEDALNGTADYLPAYELAGNSNVPTSDTVVNLIPGDGEFFLFSYPSTTDFGSGSGSICDDILIPELDVRCEDGVLNLYRRAVILNLVDGCLTQDFSEWAFLRSEGCCECSGSGSGGDDVSSGSGFYGSGGEMLISNGCCPEGAPTTLFADGSFYISKLDCSPDETPFCNCDDFTVELTYGSYSSSFFPGTLSFWRGEQDLSCGLTIQLELYCVEVDVDEFEWQLGFILFDGEDPCSGSSGLTPPSSFSGCDPFSASYLLSDVSVLQDCFACVHPSNEVYLCVAVGE